MPKALIPRPPGPRTGVQNPRCYAALFADCSVQTSSEHFLSHSLMRALSQDGITIEFAGFAWQKNDERKKLPTKRLGSKILCKRHNETLAGLDDVAKQFFIGIDTIDKSFGGGQKRDKAITYIFNGDDIERWMLKTLCGLVYSGNSSSQSGRIQNWNPSLQWLEILFGLDRFQQGWGLYALNNIRHVSEINRIFACAPISNDTVGVYGLSVVLNEKRFVLAMMRPPTSLRGTLLDGYVYRPVSLEAAGEEKIIRLSWNTVGKGERVLVEYSP
jgi:hypothetical protein